MKAELDTEIEERITMDIIVDACCPEEQAMGWYYCLKDTMEFTQKWFLYVRGQQALSSQHRKVPTKIGRLRLR